MHFLEIFGQKKCLFGSKTVFLGQEVHYYMIYIAYFTELILQICDYAQKRRIWRENYKYTLDDNFHCHFCSRRKAAKFCHPVLHEVTFAVVCITFFTESKCDKSFGHTFVIACNMSNINADGISLQLSCLSNRGFSLCAYSRCTQSTFFSR